MKTATIEFTSKSGNIVFVPSTKTAKTPAAKAAKTKRIPAERLDIEFVSKLENVVFLPAKMRKAK